MTDTTTESKPIFFTREDLAERYQLAVQTIAKWPARNYGPRSIKVGRYVRYRVTDVEAWEAEQPEGGAA